MKTCIHCGFEDNADTAGFCSNCGAELADRTEIVPECADTVNAEPVHRAGNVPASKERLVAVVLSYIAAYLFVAGTNIWYEWESLVIFAFVVISVELINKGRPHPAESFVWLGCFALSAIGFCFRLDDVWRSWHTAFFEFIFGVWWVLSRSGKLMEGKSGHLLPADAWTGIAVLPFKNYLLRFRTILACIRSHKKEGKSGKPGRIIWTICAAAACILLFVCAADLLMEADEAFGDMLGKLLDRIDYDIDDELLRDVFWSIPFGCLGCGMILGSASEDRSNIDRRRERLYGRLALIRRVSESLWAAVIGLFSVMYVAFFIIQGSYLFGAFVGKLPEGFIVAEYARQGFFELCKVMVVNSALLWMATRMVSSEMKHEKGFKVICLVLLAESILFAVIAFSKLALYISVYGFTPLRLQSTWLVCVLFAGCVLWAYTIITDRPAFRKWMIFGAVTLSVLTVV